MAKTQTVQDARRDDGAGAASGRAADAPPPTPAEALETLAQALAATAVERDRQGGHAARERELIRQSGLLRLSVPTAHGGAGASWSTVLGAAPAGPGRQRAGACIRFPPSAGGRVLLYGTPEQHAYFLEPTVARNLFWGNALNPLDRRVVARRAGRLSHRRCQELQLGLGGLGPADLLGSAQAVRHGADRRAADARRGHHRQSGLGRLRPAPDRQRHGALRPCAARARAGAAGAGRHADRARHAALAGGAADHDQSVPGHRAGRISGRARLCARRRPAVVRLGRGAPRRRSLCAGALRRVLAVAAGGPRAGRPAAQALEALARGPSVTAEERGRVAVAGAQARCWRIAPRCRWAPSCST